MSLTATYHRFWPSLTRTPQCLDGLPDWFCPWITQGGRHIQARQVEKDLLARVSQECAVFGEWTSVDWLAKVVGLYENLGNKQAVMLVGGPFSGKSACIEALAPFFAKEMREQRSEFSNRHVEVLPLPRPLPLHEGPARLWTFSIFLLSKKEQGFQ